MLTIWRGLAAGSALVGAAWLAPGAQAAPAEGSCADSSAAADLHRRFQEGSVDGLAGADYPHVIALPDGRHVWLFQDGFLGDDDDLRDDRFAHNVGLVQDGACFTRLPAPGGAGNSLIGSWVEQGLTDWVWPLDGEIGADGNLWVFVAEVRNADGQGAGVGAAPLGTWVARFSLPELELVSLEPAPDDSNELFGYAVVSDDDWSYLYGHCYRQFGPTELIGLDPACSPYAYLARVPRGRFDAQPEYWTSGGWGDDRGALEPVLTSASSMPVSVERFNGWYVAASDEGEWFGSDVVIRVAPRPEGPWEEVARYTPDTLCGPACNNYGAFIAPWLEDGDLVVVQSNNSWDMSESLADGRRYRISVRRVDVPRLDTPPPVPATTEPPESSPATSSAAPVGTPTPTSSTTPPPTVAPRPLTVAPRPPDADRSGAVAGVIAAGALAAVGGLWFVSLARAWRATRRRRQRAREGTARRHHR